jgi:hypothetical protein
MAYLKLDQIPITKKLDEIPVNKPEEPKPEYPTMVDKVERERLIYERIHLTPSVSLGASNYWKVTHNGVSNK